MMEKEAPRIPSQGEVPESEMPQEATVRVPRQKETPKLAPHQREATKA